MTPPACLPDCRSTRLLEQVAAFEACTIPREDWNHRAHLTYALVMLIRYGPGDGARRIREGILRYAAVQRIEQTPSGGYHESITRFYIWVVQRFIAQVDVGRALHELADELYDRYGDRDLPFQYYSRERLMSWEARTSWLEPDLRPLG